MIEDRLEKVRAEIERRIKAMKDNFGTDDVSKIKHSYALRMIDHQEILSFINSLPEEPVSNKIEVSYDAKINEAHRLGREEGILLAKTMFKEPVSKDRLAFKALPRLLEMLEPNDRAKAYTNRLADALEKEGYNTDANIVREKIRVMNGATVAMATMDEEAVSEDLETEIDNTREKYRGLESLCEHDVIEICEHFFKFGADWQRQQTINKSCDYLKDNIWRNLYCINGEAGFPTAEFIKDLRKYLEE